MGVVGAPATPHRTRPIVLLVGAVMLVGSLYSALTPLLPHYVEELSLSKTSAGIFVGAYSAGQLLGSLPSAWLAMRAGARRALLIGLTLKCGAGLVFAFGHTILVLDVSLLLMGVGGACTWSGAMGWLTSATPPEVRGATIGRAMSAVVVGLLVGPVVGAVGLETGPELPFTVLALLTGVLGLVAASFAAPPRPAVPDGPPLRALRDARVRFGAWLLMLVALTFGAFELLVPLRLDSLGAGGVVIAATFLAAAALEGVAQLHVGRIADRRGRMLPIRVGLVGTLVALVLLPLPQAIGLLAVVVVLVWVAGGVVNTPAMTLLSDGIEARGLEQGVGFALVNFVAASGTGIGSIAGGALAARTSDAVVFFAFAALFALTFAALARRRADRWVHDQIGAG